ncbi:sugar transferase [Ornithinibacillus halotolerans]|uniref:sugar transferase n=1 Tax=Ornithinibacillus halotolerans TaxID=1274357 RepID=UPI001E381815|nr:sugar transferase [Ornithinibacillus halotolerans]
MKKSMDIIISSIFIVIFTPLCIIIAVAIKRDSKGPILFKQKRLTKNGREFTMYKFRTMIENAEYMGTGLFNYENDFRVTKVGRLLRNTSLDELPQLINILKGDMALIGPRPPVSYELGKYENLNEAYKRRFTVLPGITGLAQVKGRNELPWDEKVKFDNEYIDLFHKYGILIDLKILALTIINVFKMKNIYEVEEESSSIDITEKEEPLDEVFEKK